jgi:hypothetical protein
MLPPSRTMILNRVSLPRVCFDLLKNLQADRHLTGTASSRETNPARAPSQSIRKQVFNANTINIVVLVYKIQQSVVGSGHYGLAHPCMEQARPEITFAEMRG